MFRLILFAIFATGSFAQDAADVSNKPPADVDQALRARITEFYDLHVKGDFRKAEALVAEDSKDYYFNSTKVKYLSFEIQRIDYSDSFTRAKAAVLCGQYSIIPLPGLLGRPMKAAMPSTWKLVDGTWYWYMDPESLRMTPFGKMTPGPPRKSESETGPPTIPAIPAAVPNFIYELVKADKASVTLKAGESEQVTITNGAPGAMNISLTGTLPGVEVKLDRTILNAGEKAVLTVQAGADAKSGVLSIQVEQTNQVIPIQVGIK
jgi:hypothetical protein